MVNKCARLSGECIVGKGLEIDPKNVFVLLMNQLFQLYSQLSLRRTPLGPALSLRLREVSVLWRVK